MYIRHIQLINTIFHMLKLLLNYIQNYTKTTHIEQYFKHLYKFIIKNHSNNTCFEIS